jgi:hypothetical protein
MVDPTLWCFIFAKTFCSLVFVAVVVGRMIFAAEMVAVLIQRMKQFFSL